MPTSTPNPPPMPDINEPLVDVKTGQIAPTWFKWLAFYDRIWRQLRKEIP